MSTPDNGGYDPDQDPAYELLVLLAEEFVAGDIACRAIPGDGSAPAQLLVPLESETTTATVHLYFLPDPEQPPVLQYLVAFEHDVLPAAVDTTARFLHLLNSSIPVTGFELGEAAGAVVFRHTQALSVHPLDPGVIAWPLSMIFHAVTSFEQLVGQACSGASYPELVAGFGRVQAALFAPEGADS